MTTRCLFATAIVTVAIVTNCKFVEERTETCVTAGDSFRVGARCRSPGVCGEGVVECAGPFSTRCSTSPEGSQSRARDEVCDGLDNDCDGERDEGYGVGETCTLPGGCIGRRECVDIADDDGGVDGHSGAGDGGAQTECVVDDTARTREVCDGLDNDCDGYIDYSIGPVRLLSACDCVEKSLSFGAVPRVEDDSDLPNAADGGPFCSETTCSGSGGELAMAFCLNCARSLYAMCVSEGRTDLTPFVEGKEDRALTVRFTLESATEAKARVNLYYQVDRRIEAGRSVSVRRYFPLLAIGDRAGTYTRRFLPVHTCFAKSDETRCAGESSTCPGCRSGDSCGAPKTDCEPISFESSQLQVAVEDECSGDDFKGVIRIHELSWGPLSCMLPSAP